MIEQSYYNAILRYPQLFLCGFYKIKINIFSKKRRRNRLVFYTLLGRELLKDVFEKN